MLAELGVAAAQHQRPQPRLPRLLRLLPGSMGGGDQGHTSAVGRPSAFGGGRGGLGSMNALLGKLAASNARAAESEAESATDEASASMSEAEE